jgi:hypothetical protein
MLPVTNEKLRVKPLSSSNVLNILQAHKTDFKCLFNQVSGKRSLDGNAGKCPTTGLQNELSDDKIGGRNNGQKSEQWH